MIQLNCQKKAHYKNIKKMYSERKKKERRKKKKMKKDKKQVFYNLYIKDEDMEIRPINEFTSYKEIERHLKDNYNVKTSKQAIYNSIKYNCFINDNFIVYRD